MPEANKCGYCGVEHNPFNGCRDIDLLATIRGLRHQIARMERENYNETQYLKEINTSLFNQLTQAKRSK